MFCGTDSPNILWCRRYWKVFNINGIIFVIKDDLNNIEKILKQCNERDYLERVPAILDNYERVKQYKN